MLFLGLYFMNKYILNIVNKTAVPATTKTSAISYSNIWFKSGNQSEES